MMNVRPRCTVSPCFCRCRFLPPAIPPRLLDLCRRIHGKPGVRLQQMLGLLGWRLGGGDRGSCGSAAACGPCYALPPRKGQSGAGYIFSGAATRAGPVLEDSHHRLADFNPGMTNVGGAMPIDDGTNVRTHDGFSFAAHPSGLPRDVVAGRFSSLGKDSLEVLY